MAPPLWWVESSEVEAPIPGRGVALRLGATVAGESPPAALLLYPGKRALSVRGRGNSGKESSSRFFEVVLKGAARRELKPGGLLFAAAHEQYNTTTALVSCENLQYSATGSACSVRIPDVPPEVADTLQVALSAVRPWDDRHALLQLTRALPLIPGCDYELHQGRRCGRLTVVLALPAHGDVNAATSAAAGLLAGGLPIEQVTYRVWGIVGHLPAQERSSWLEQQEPAPIDIGGWWTAPSLLDRCVAALQRAARRHEGIGSRDAVRVVSEVSGVGGPAFSMALVSWAAADGTLLVKRDGRYFPADVARDQVLPPAARQLRQEIERCGRTGYDAARNRHPNTRALVESLQRLGFAVVLDNARVVSAHALQTLAQEAQTHLSGSDRELHQRQLAQLWGLPRNSARAVTARLVADGLLERASSVHVRLPRRARRKR